MMLTENVLASSGTGTQPFGFEGNQTDPGSGLGLDNFNAREYDPTTGRFISPDPVSGALTSPETLNPYAYGADNPFSNPDPTGLCFIVSCSVYNTVGGGLSAARSFVGNAEVSGIDFVGNQFGYSNAQIASGVLTVGAYLPVSGQVEYYQAETASGGHVSWTALALMTIGDFASLAGDPEEELAAGGVIDASINGSESAAERTYQTYIKINEETGQAYAGRTSGYGTPEENLLRRDASHAYNEAGFGPAQLDQSSTSYAAIRGREQQLIENFQEQGISANKINGIGPNNPNGPGYIQAANEAFGGGP